MGRKWAVASAAVGIGLVVLVLSAPWIASRGPFRRLLLGRINAGLNGRLEVEAWDLAWFSGQEFEGIRLRDAEGNVVGQADRVRLDAALARLLGRRKALGQVQVDAPRLDLVVDEEGRTNLQKIFPKGEGPARPPAFDVSGVMAVRDGQLTLGTGEAEPFAVRDLSLDLTIRGLDKPIAYHVAAKAGRARGPVEASGEAALFNAGMPAAPRDFQSKAKVKVGGVDLAELSPVAQRMGVPVSVAGTLTADVDASLAGLSAAEAKGRVEVGALALAGGPLGTDRPQFDRVRAAFDVSLKEGAVSVRRLEVESPVLAASASGELAAPPGGAAPEGRVEGRVRLDLPALAARFPGTLRLQEGLTVNTGSADVDIRLAAAGGARELEGTLKVADLAAVRGAQRIRPEAPIVLTLKAAQPKDGRWSVESLTLGSSFATVKASGDAERFAAEATLDLRAATAELGKFVDLGKRSAVGRAFVALHVAPAAEGRRLAADVRLEDLDLRGFGPEPLTEKALTVAIRGDFDRRADAPLSAVGLDARLEGSFGKVVCTAARLDLPERSAGLKALALDGARLEASEADLARIAAIGRTTGLLPAGVDLRGAATLAVDASAAKGDVALKQLVLSARAFEYRSGEKALREPSLSLALAAEASPGARRAVVRGLELKTSAGSLAVPEARTDDWSLPAGGVIGAAKGQFDIARLLAAAGDFVRMPENTTAAGTWAFDLAIRPAAAGVQAVRLDSRAGDLYVVRRGYAPFREPALALSAQAQVDRAKETLRFDTLNLASQVFALDAAGASYTAWSGARRLRAEGMLTADFARLAPLASTLAGRSIEMSGKKSGPFSLDTSLKGETWHAILAETTAAADLYVAGARAAGLEVGEFTLALRADREKKAASAALDAPANEGRLTLRPYLDLSGGRPVLRLPEKTTVADKVRLNEGAANELLARVVPLFADCVATGGKVTFRVDSLSLPLTPGLRGAAEGMVGALRFDGVAFSSAGWLGTVLRAARLSEKAIAVRDQEVSVAFRDGRFHHGRLELSSEKHPVYVSGAYGLDGRMDMVIEVPYTQALVRDERLWRLVEGATFKIPVGGTPARPEFDPNLIQRNVEDLARSALERLVQERLERILRGD